MQHRTTAGFTFIVAVVCVMVSSCLGYIQNMKIITTIMTVVVPIFPEACEKKLTIVHQEFSKEFDSFLDKIRNSYIIYIYSILEIFCHQNLLFLSLLNICQVINGRLPLSR